MSKTVLFCLFAYLIGNISPSIIISRAKGEDVRTKGSGNAGATNMLRTYGKKAAALTLFIDVIKGVLGAAIGYLAEPPLVYACALAVILGHIWPVIYRFKGGKGIATGFGAMLAVSPLSGGTLAAVALATMVLTKMVSPGSLAAAAALPLLAYLRIPDFFPYALAIAGVVIFKHRSNISRIIKGEEAKIKFGERE